MNLKRKKEVECGLKSEVTVKEKKRRKSEHYKKYVISYRIFMKEDGRKAEYQFKEAEKES